MELPANFSEPLGEEPHHYFRNLCIRFRKLVETSKDLGLLEREMQRFINASKEMNWHYKNNRIQRKNEGEKAAEKVWTEFERYRNSLQSNPSSASSQDLIQALHEVEKLVRQSKVT